MNHAVTKEQAALGKQVLGQLGESALQGDTVPIWTAEWQWFL